MVLTDVHAQSICPDNDRDCGCARTNTGVKPQLCPAHQIRDVIIEHPAEFVVSWMLAACRD